MRSRCKTHTWQAFWKATTSDENAQEIAADLGMSLAVVYTAKSRVLARPRKAAAESSGAGHHQVANKDGCSCHVTSWIGCSCHVTSWIGLIWV